jgi:hypothetical protein
MQIKLCTAMAGHWPSDRGGRAAASCEAPARAALPDPPDADSLGWAGAEPARIFDNPAASAAPAEF